MHAPPIPVYIRYATLAVDESPTQMKTWTDFLTVLAPAAEVAGIVLLRRPCPLAEQPPLMEPMEA